MIDFRYHLVSLIAVFLAIALGVIIGTTALNDPISADIETRVQTLEQDKRSLEDRIQALDGQLDTADGFEQAVAPALVAGALAGRSVLLLATGEDVPDEVVEEVGGLVTDAGGTVGGIVRLQPGYTDPATASGLRTYVTSPGIPAGVQLPTTDDPGQLVAALLGQTLMVPEPGAAAPDAATVSSVLAGLAALDVLSVESSSVAAADHAVVLTAAGPDGDGGEGAAGDGAEEDGAGERTATLVELVTALDAAGSGAVVAGTAESALDGGLVAAIRADPEISAAVSTVDNVERAAGRISTVLALGQESQGTSGTYGAGEDTQPVPPVPAAAVP